MNQPFAQGAKPEAQDRLDLGELSNSLGFLLRMAQIEVFNSFHEELGEYGLKPGEFSVFWLIGQYPGVRQGLIANSLSIKQAHMSKLVRGLEDRSFVTRAIPDTDRRSVLLSVTDAGKTFLAEIENEFFGHSFASNNKLTKDETATLVDLLQKYTGISSSKYNGTKA